MSTKITSLSIFASICLISAPVLSANAQSLDSALDCQATPHAFVSDLMRDHKIAPTPVHVESNSVNAFRTVDGGDVSALGFNVGAVVGYQANDPLFRSGKGRPIERPLYGVVVSASVDAVSAKLQDAKLHATVHQVVPMVMTAIVCEPQ
ncbi:hypothetical protein [Paraburkholderia sp. C35]|uniref:hypothetical protein n=1 Tax=Paraburkholderia sp. C35 TaxID=2126993 RepID=UPI000D68DA39|nr:hypothetical protein [Paraburkholderia sp. C35]